MDTEDDYNWSLEVKHKCSVCGHIERNEDIEENCFIVFDEKLHSIDRYSDPNTKTWTQMMCPKCNHLIVTRW